ncbi:lipase [Folsomia candida]|uniref:Lipase n=1 Tax=Folsomia candida TaxID=158441 RepID=A0A226DD38_FOLCA|nr:lipase [Folsomia candida]OXA42166.1 Lipase [Folsomia candida]
MFNFWKSIFVQVVRQLGLFHAANPSFHVVITGHSSRGAMASLLVFLLTTLRQFPTMDFTLATFGQPRTGNEAYANYMNALFIPTNRVVARADIIPHFPPVTAFGFLNAFLGVNYIHHGQEVWINGNDTIFCSKAVYEDPTCSNSLGPIYTIVDHLQYFDADYSVCYFVEGWLDIDLLSLDGFTPTNFIPPMPTIDNKTISRV